MSRSAAPPNAGGRVSPSTALYRAVIMEIERRRSVLDLPMWKVDDLAGTQDGYLAKALAPDSPSGRQARWETLQLIIDALYPQGIELKIESINGAMPSALSTTGGKSEKSLQVRHWRHTRYFRDLGAKGGRNYRENVSPRRRKIIARRAAKVRWKKWRAKQREDLSGTSCETENRPKPSDPECASRSSSSSRAAASAHHRRHAAQP